MAPSGTMLYDNDENAEVQDDAHTAATLASLKGLTVTDASYSPEDGFMVEYDGRYRIRSCSAHTVVLVKSVQ